MKLSPTVGFIFSECQHDSFLSVGNSISCDHAETCNHDSPQKPFPSGFPESVSGWSDSRENMPCTSRSPTDNGFSCENSFSKFSDYSFVCDVNSLAWGICGDGYNQHKDTVFREFLFVSGNHGVTVHAFCENRQVRETTQFTLKGEFAQGMWVEWGPSSTSVHYRELEKDEKWCYDVPGIVLDVNGSSGTKGSSNFCGRDGDDDSIRSVCSKKWLQSFLTKAETVESKGNICTRFPEKPSYPCSAKVVSFTIFESSSPLCNLVAQMNWISNENKTHEEAALNSVNDDVFVRPASSSSSLAFEPDVLSSSFSLNSSYKCSKVFSNHSHNLIGFVLTVFDENTATLTESGWKNILLAIARLDCWGMQWVGSVKLDESLNMCSPVGWMDFQFSDNLLICLNASGLILFYSTITGEYVANLDVLHTCGFGPQPSLPEQVKMVVGGDLALRNADLKIKPVHEKSNHQISNFCGKRMFRRLVVAAHTALLAAVDDYGVIYVIYTGDHVSDKYYPLEKLVKCFHHLGVGILAGWEIGGSEIGYQNLFSTSNDSNIADIMDEAFSVGDDTESSEIQQKQNWNLHYKGPKCALHLSGFSAASGMMDERFPSSELPPQQMRKIFLPPNKLSEDDFFCLSAFGITRLIKKQKSNGKRSFQILHSCLHVDSVVNDDGCLNSGCGKRRVKWTEEASEGEAVGCTFQGCFYLVTQGGLSVVLPSVSISPNFLPIEAIGYRQSSISTVITHKAKNMVEMEESKWPWPPWKVEVLDRVLLYEGPDEADCLCLENGEN